MSALIPGFADLNDRDKLLSVLCPSTTEIAKNVSKFVNIMTETRKNLDNGLSSDMLNFYAKH